MPPLTGRQYTALRRLAAAAFIVIGHFCSAAPSVIGVHPLDEKYFDSEMIKCKEGSKWFSRERINDDFCDCIDGTDEPGTSACPRGRFYCWNVGNRPQFLFSSHVNDNICDCCDGSDEYDSSINCPNTCIMGGNLEYKPLIHRPTINHRSSINIKGRQLGGKYDEWIQNLKGLKLFAIFQLVIIGLVLAFRLFGRRFKSRRRRHRLWDLP